MNQRREGYFWVSADIYDYSTEEIHQEYIDSLNQLQFTKIKTMEGNRFAIPLQDVWANPEKTHLVYSVCDFTANTNYLRISGDEKEPESIRKLTRQCAYFEYTELCEVADEALKEEDEEAAIRAIFNIGIGYYLFEPPAKMFFERYLKSPSVKVRLATIRAIGFQLWNECTPILENLIQNDPNPAVREYAVETLKQIQNLDFDPDDLYEHPENYPNSFEGITEKGLTILPQIKDDLQAWMKKQGYLVMDALLLYQYLLEVYGEFKPTEETVQSDTTKKQKEPENSQSQNLARLQQELKNSQQKLAQLRTKQIELEQRIKDNRKTDIFGRNTDNLNRQKDNLNREIEEIEAKIAEQESLLKAKEE